MRPATDAARAPASLKQRIALLGRHDVNASLFGSPAFGALALPLFALQPPLLSELSLSFFLAGDGGRFAFLKGATCFSLPHGQLRD